MIMGNSRIVIGMMFGLRLSGRGGGGRSNGFIFFTDPLVLSKQTERNNADN